MFREETPCTGAVPASLYRPARQSLKQLGRLVVAMTLVSSAAQAALVEDKKNLGWQFKYNLTSAQFSSEFTKYNDAGYLLTDIDAYPSGSSTLYSMVWRKNDGRGWAVHRDLTSADFSTYWNQYTSQGMRLVDVEAYPLNGQIRWAGIWVQNKEGYNWSSHRGLTASEYASLFTSKKNAGWRPVELDVYNTSNGLRYNSIWQHNSDGRGWAALRDMSRESYQTEVDNRGDAGYHVVDFESYDTPNGQRYAAIWEKHGNLAHAVRTDRDQQTFLNYWYDYTDQGYRLVDFERYNTDDGVRYAGVWQENDSRFRNADKTAINNAITSYRTLNNLPGISVVVMQNGSTIYRRGFGFADVNDNKTAHAATVYNAASVAKVYGGTLAAKLEQNQARHNGTPLLMDLDLDDQTSSYLNNMPAAHQHTVAETLSHLGCVPHYNTNPSIGDQTTHYSSAMAAVQSIWNGGVVSNCTPGNTWSYSTHAFTFAGAVLEQVSGRTVNQLLRDELFTPYGLSSTRVMYDSSNLPSNSLRATPYRERDAIGSQGQPGFDPPHPVNNPNIESSYTNSSWKILGGGIETNTLDLAKFGWKVLNAEIVDADTRDNRLWTRVNPNRTHGLGWSVGNSVAGQRIAEWNGSWDGSRTWLRVYRDDGLVIAIQSNRRRHAMQDLNSLADTIAGIVLAP